MTHDELVAEIQLLDIRIAGDKLNECPQVRDAVCVMEVERKRMASMLLSLAQRSNEDIKVSRTSASPLLGDLPQV